MVDTQNRTYLPVGVYRTDVSLVWAGWSAGLIWFWSRCFIPHCKIVLIAVFVVQLIFKHSSDIDMSHYEPQPIRLQLYTHSSSFKPIIIDRTIFLLDENYIYTVNIVVKGKIFTRHRKLFRIWDFLKLTSEVCAWQLTK